MGHLRNDPGLLVFLKYQKVRGRQALAGLDPGQGSGRGRAVGAQYEKPSNGNCRLRKLGLNAGGLQNTGRPASDQACDLALKSR